MKLRRAACLLAIACSAGAACIVDDKLAVSDVDEPPSGTTTDAVLNVALALVDASGAPPAGHAFVAPEDAYFALRVADAGAPVVAEDYVFQVVAADGSLVSSDPLACRRFHVSANGVIDGVHTASLASGSACTHRFTRTESRGLIVQTMPFAIGGEQFALRVGPATRHATDDDFATALAVAFAIVPAAPPPPDDEDPPPEEPPPEEPPPEEPPPPGGDDDDDDDDGDDDDGGGGNGGNGGGNGNGNGNGNGHGHGN